MKRKISIFNFFYIITPFIILFFSFPSYANSKELNIYNWSNYLPQKVIYEFEKKTGIKVNYSTFTSNAALYAKLKSDPTAGYDIVVPSNYYVEKMIKEGMLHKINIREIANLKYIKTNFLNQPFDPHNQYSVPYLWGATGIVINDKYFKPEEISKWFDIWNPNLENQLVMLDDFRDVFSVALIALGYSVNDKNPKHIKEAYLKLKTLYPNIKLFNSSAPENIYIDEDATIGMGWTGDSYQAASRNSHLKFIYPEDGYAYFIDCLCIPKFASHISNAYKFINFVLQPKIAAQIAAGIGYSTPNDAAWQYMPKSMRDSPII